MKCTAPDRVTEVAQRRCFVAAARSGATRGVIARPRSVRDFVDECRCSARVDARDADEILRPT